MNTELRRKRQELRVIEAQIIERKLYLAEQERHINELIESGNMRLMELNHDILYAESLLKEIKAETRRFRSDKWMLEEDLRVLRLELAKIPPSITFGIITEV